MGTGVATSRHLNKGRWMGTQFELEKGVAPLKTKMYSHCNLLVRENKRQLKRMKGAKAKKTGRQKEDWLELLLILTPTLFKGVG